MYADAVRVICVKHSGDNDESKREDDVEAEDLNLRRDNDEDELEHVHEHIERILYPVDDTSFFLDHGLLH